jgi:hypothetical protein
MDEIIMYIAEIINEDGNDEEVFSSQKLQETIQFAVKHGCRVVAVTYHESDRETIFDYTLPAEPAAPHSYKVGVKTSGDRDWVYNGLRFATEKAALDYGRDLSWRWTAVTEYEVHPSEDAPTEVK